MKAVRLPKGHSEAANTPAGLGFGLTDEEFNRWWHNAILPEDGQEFVHLLQGTMEAARMVCAFHWLTAVDKRPYTSALIVDAYMIAKNWPEDKRKETATWVSAQALFEDQATQMLLDRVRYRSRRLAESRIASRTAAKIEELYRRAEDDEFEGYHEKLRTEQLALEAATGFLKIEAKERETLERQRSRKAVEQAMSQSKDALNASKRVPTVEEFKQFLAMMREALGTNEFRQIIAAVSPEELPDGTGP